MSTAKKKPPISNIDDPASSSYDPPKKKAAGKVEPTLLKLVPMPPEEEEDELDVEPEAEGVAPPPLPPDEEEEEDEDELPVTMVVPEKKPSKIGENGVKIATLADVRKRLGNVPYTWKGWIQPGTITTLAAEAGTGKTLVALKLCEIVWKGLPWPDGAENAILAGTPAMWLPYDRNWNGLLRAAADIGLPDEAIILPTGDDQPMCVPDLDNPDTVLLLERLIQEYKPWSLIIDTMTYASGFNVAKAHEAKLAYGPLMGVLSATGCCCISSTHLSAEGQVLNRRPVELSRTVMKLKAADPADGSRLKFWVFKSDDEKPAPLGVTIGGDGLVAFDDVPPLDGEGSGPKHGTKPGPQPKKSTKFAEWLFEYLEYGPSSLADIIDAARDEELLKAPAQKDPTPSLASLYNAKNRIPRVYKGWEIREYGVPSKTGGKPRKHWERFQPGSEQPATIGGWPGEDEDADHVQ
jgi:hypothetical protein